MKGEIEDEQTENNKFFIHTFSTRWNFSHNESHEAHK